MRPRWQRVAAVAAKEATELLRDVRTLVSIILLPVLLVPVFLYLGLSTATRLQEGDKSAVYTLAVDTAGLTLEDLPLLPESLRPIAATGPLPDLVASGEAEVGLARNAEGGFEIFYDGARSDRSSLLSKDILDLYLAYTWYQANLVEKLAAVGVDPVHAFPPPVRETDISTPEELGAFGLALILPLLVLVIVMQALSFPATDIMAGERERHTVESLLALPLTRLEIVLGKALVVGMLGLAPLVVNLVVIMYGLTTLAEGAVSFAPSDLAVAFLAGLPIVAFFTGLFLLLAAVARSTREANAYLAPVLLLFLGGGVMALFGGDSALWVYVVPGLGGAAGMRDWLAGEGGLLAVLGAVVSLGGGAAALIGAARRLDSEETVLGVGGVQWRRWWRQGRDHKRAPTPWEALILFLLLDTLFILFGLPWTAKNILAGTFFSQAIFFGLLPLVAVWALGLGRRAVGLGRPHAHLAIGVGLGLAAWSLSIPFAVLGQKAFPANEAMAEALQALMMDPPLLLVLGVVALTPALFEEFVFRGVVLSGLRRLGAPVAIIGSAVLFALAHMDPPRLLFTLVLGVILAWLRLRTGSIWMGVVVHFTLNATSVLGARLLPETFELWLGGLGWGEMAALFVIGAGVLALATKLLPLAKEEPA